MERRYTLAENWRSEPELIRAVNTLFSRPRHAFLYEAVPFEKAQAAGREAPVLTFGGRREAPLRLWALDGGGGTVNVADARERIRRAVAAEIARLVEAGRRGEALIGTERLREADVAVLVRTNREALLTQEALTDLGVHSVVYTTGNLFDTQEARQMELLLRGVAQPNEETAVRTALATDLLGLDGAAIDGLMGDARAWEERLRRFHDWRETWERHGFVRMFRELMAAEQVRPRLLSLPGGERRLTNVLHLAEVLHGEEMRRRSGMGGLIQWLAANRDEETPRREEHQLRLESDADAVKVVTIHKSKGLEYPVVFCPFNWGPSRAGRDVYSFHDEADGWRLNVALESVGEEARRAAEREQLAENVRLLYVSVTRAKNRCYLVWGPINKAETSSLAYILHPPEGSLESVVDETAAHVSAMDEESLRRDLEAIASASAGAVEYSLLPEGPAPLIEPYAGRDRSSRGAGVSPGRGARLRDRKLLLPRRGGGPGSRGGRWPHGASRPRRTDTRSGSGGAGGCLRASLPFPAGRGQGSASTPFSSASISPAPNGAPLRRSWARRLRSTAMSRAGATPCAT